MNYIIGVHFPLLIAALLGGQDRMVDVDGALSRIEEWKRSYDWAQLRDWAAVIRSQAPEGDQLVARRLLNVATNEGIPKPVAAEAMRLACEMADEVVATEIVSTLADACMAFPGDEAGGRDRNGWNILMIVAIEERLAHLERAMTNQEPIQELLTVIGLGNCKVAVAWQGWDALGESSAPLAMRQASALEIIEGNQRTPVFPKSMRGLLGPEMLPALREIVRRPVDAEPFNLWAASALAHYGDLEILPDLEALVPKLAAVRPSLSANAQAYIRMINVQNPPSKILEHIAQHSGRWTMERALELGFSKAEVRDALLLYVEKLKSEGIENTDSLMIGAKRQGSELGVLQPDDLANILVPKLDMEY